MDYKTECMQKCDAMVAQVLNFLRGDAVTDLDTLKMALANFNLSLAAGTSLDSATDVTALRDAYLTGIDASLRAQMYAHYAI